MKDKIKEAYEATKSTGLFVDEADFREQLNKDPKGVYGVFQSDENTKGIFVDENDFYTSLGLKGASSEGTPAPSATSSSGPMKPFRGNLGEKPKVAPTNVRPVEKEKGKYVPPQAQGSPIQFGWQQSQEPVAKSSSPLQEKPLRIDRKAVDAYLDPEEKKRQQQAPSEAAQYEAAQSRLKEETDFNINSIDTWEKYNGGQPSQNIQEQREQKQKLIDDHNARMAVLQSQAEQATVKFDAIVKKDIERELAEGALTMANSNGAINVPDPVKIAAKADKIAKQYGLGSDSHTRRYLYDKIISEVQFQILKPEIEKNFQEDNKDLITQAKWNEAKAVLPVYEEKQKFEAQAAALADQFALGQKHQINEVTAQYEQAAQTVVQAWEQKSAQYAQQFNQLNLAYQSGQMPRDQYEKQFEDLKAAHEQDMESVKQQLPSYTEYIQKVHDITSKNKLQYQREVEQMQKTAERKINEAIENAGKNVDEGTRRKIEEAYKKAYTKAFQSQQEKLRDSDNFYSVNASEMIWHEIGLFAKSTASALGGAMKGLGTTMGSESVQLAGDYLQQKYVISQPNTEEFADLLDPNNLAKVTGQLAGGMLPSIAATAVTTLVTGGVGAPVAISAMAGNIAGFATETADIAGRAYDEAFKESGNAGKAAEAYQKSLQSQFDIALLYSLEFLPFVDNGIGMMKSKAGRMVLGGVAELSTEFPQEYLQNIAEENIRLGSDPWSGLAEKISNGEGMKSTFISIAPVAILGGAGQINSKSATNPLSDYFIAQKSKEMVSRVVEGQQEQLVQNMVYSSGEKKTRQTIATMFTAGQITEQQANVLLDQVANAVQFQAVAKAAKLSDNDRAVYSFYASRADHFAKQAESTNDPIMKDVYAKQSADFKKAGVEFLRTGNMDLISVQYKDGSQYFITPDQMQGALSDPAIAKLLKDGDMKMFAFGPEGKRVASEFAKEINEANENIVYALNNNKIKGDDSKNEQGVSSKERGGEAVVEAQPDQGAGAAPTGPSGMVQAPSQEEVELNDVRLRINQIEAARQQGKILEDGSPNELKNLKSREKELSTVVSEQVAAKPTEDIEAKKADIERRRQEELKERVIYDRKPTVEDGEFRIVGDPNKQVYRINENTGRLQVKDRETGLWTVEGTHGKLELETAQRSGFEKLKENINAKYDNELAALEEVKPTLDQTEEEVKVELDAEQEAASETEFQAVVYEVKAAYPTLTEDEADHAAALVQEGETVEQAVAHVREVPENGTEVKLPPVIKGGMERTMVFEDGVWKQKVGGIVTEVGAKVQEQAQASFEEANAPVVETPVTSETTVVKEENAPNVGESQQKEAFTESAVQETGTEAKSEQAAAGDFFRKKAQQLRELTKGKNAAENVSKFLESSGITVETLDDSEYDETVKNESGQTSETEGIFIADNGKIYLKKSKIDGEWGRVIAFHEGIHPVINIIRNVNPKAYQALVDGVMQAAKTNVGVAKVVKMVKSAPDYVKKGEKVVEDEVVVEVLAQIAAGKINLSNFNKTTLEKIVDFMNSLAKVFGLPKVFVNSPRAELQNLAKQLTKALNNQGNIADIVGKKNVGKFQNALSQARLTSDEIAKNTENKTKAGKIQPSMQLTAKKKGETVTVYSGASSVDAIRSNKPEMYISRALELSKTHLVKGTVKKYSSSLTKDQKLKWADNVYKKAKETVVSNLLFVYDNINEDVRNISKLWYDGANIIAQEMSKKYGVTLEQAAAVIATQSPQKPWFDNVHLAHFILDFYSNNQETLFDQSDFDYYKSKTIDPSGKPYTKQIEYLPQLEKSIGKPFSELSEYDKSAMIRARFDQNYERNAPLRVPTGAIVDAKVKALSSFSGYDTIAKAVSILQDGSDQNISDNIGNAYKVRNFYNNIASPQTDGEVTIDTHAMAVAYFLPLGSSSAEVKFDEGTYSFFADAYREAAKQRGVLAREMQSITWEGARAIFPAKEKTEKSKKAVKDVWADYNSGKITLEEAQNKIKEYGKDLSITDWGGFIDEIIDEDKTATYLKELSLISRDKLAAGQRAKGTVDSGLPAVGKRGRKVVGQASAMDRNQIKSGFEPSKVFSGANEDVANASDQYKEENGLSQQTPSFILSVSENDAKRVADAYEKMKHDPENPQVKQGFSELITEIKKQAEVLLSMGYKFQLSKEGEGYGSDSTKMADDVRKNKRIFVDPSSKSFGTKRTFDKDNVGLQDSGYKDANGVPMTNVELIRAVHDLFGHAEFGNGFGAIGEENAWRNHMSMFTPLAQKALTTTTRGQNSWVNFGPHMRNEDGSIKKSGDKGYLPASQRPFAEQKIGFLPDWAMDNSYGDKVVVNGRSIKPVNKYVLEGTEMYEIDDSKAFYEAIKTAKESRGLDGIQVSLKSAKEYQNIIDNGGRLIVTKDGLSGLMVEADGNVGSGFVHSDIPAGKNTLKPLLLTAIKLGARYTDAYDTYLPAYYAKFGFKPLNRIKFNEEFADEGWEKTTLSSRPDVVVMYWDGGSRESVDKNYGKFEPYSKSQGEYTDDYDGAIESAKEKSLSIEPSASLVPPKIPTQASALNRNSIEDTYYEPHMTEDGGDYIFFHVSSADKKSIAKGIDSTKFYSTRTSREEKGLQYGVASFYTKPKDGERMVGGEKYVVRVPKNKVYPMDLDPNNYREKAEKKFPTNTPFRYSKISKAVADMAKKDGFKMAVGEWNYSRAGKKTNLPEFRADALTVLKPTGENVSDFTSNMDKGMEEISHPEKASLEAKEKLKSIAYEIASYWSSKRKYNDAYSLAERYRVYGDVVVNQYQENEYTREMTREDFDLMTKGLPKSFDAKISEIKESLPSEKSLGQASALDRGATSEAVDVDLFSEIDSALNAKGQNAITERNSLKEKYGDKYKKAVKITREFGKIVERLEKEGKITKQC